MLQALSKNKKIGIISLASTSDPEAVRRGLEYLSALGYEYKLAPDPSAAFEDHKHLFFAASLSERLAALDDFIADEEVGAILAARGGYGTMELLPSLKPERHLPAEKPFVGFSDVTALLLHFSRQPNSPAIHGPLLLSAFSKATEHPEAAESADVLLRFLEGRLPQPLEGLSLEHLAGPDEAQGELLGGNLSLLASLCGTPWQPDYRGKILFFEEVGEQPYRIHRMLVQLRLAGVFEQVAAVVVGDLCYDCAPKPAPQMADVLADIFSSCQFPVFSGLPVGHGLRNYPVPLGISARVSGQGISLLQPVFKVYSPG